MMKGTMGIIVHMGYRVLCFRVVMEVLVKME